MHAVVVYESFWGNTAAIARAIAEGIGPGATAMTTDEATAEVVAHADMIVAGAPVLGFRLPTDEIRDELYHESGAPKPADTMHPSMRAWLGQVPAGQAAVAAFDGDAAEQRFDDGGKGDLERLVDGEQADPVRPEHPRSLLHRSAAQ